ncbi:MAG: hypothetical protein TREMPRED_005582 [Tremellales sp. Tagirdzhanova-0007]|nr:MAG: hypothetical protein TREMPRED_005582 [Tremellales sp. Tagirdzhanova-0007]
MGYGLRVSKSETDITLPIRSCDDQRIQLVVSPRTSGQVEEVLTDDRGWDTCQHPAVGPGSGISPNPNGITPPFRGSHIALSVPPRTPLLDGEGLSISPDTLHEVFTPRLPTQDSLEPPPVLINNTQINHHLLSLSSLLAPLLAKQEEARTLRAELAVWKALAMGKPFTGTARHPGDEGDGRSQQERSSRMLLAVLDGNTLQFDPVTMSQGYNGGRHAARLLRACLYGAEGNRPLLQAQSNEEGRTVAHASEAGDLVIHIIIDKPVLLRELRDAGCLVSAETFDAFWHGLIEEDGLLNVIDAAIFSDFSASLSQHMAVDSISTEAESRSKSPIAAGEWKNTDQKKGKSNNVVQHYLSAQECKAGTKCRFGHHYGRFVEEDCLYGGDACRFKSLNNGHGENASIAEHGTEDMLYLK